MKIIRACMHLKHTYLNINCDITISKTQAVLIGGGNVEDMNI